MTLKIVLVQERLLRSDCASPSRYCAWTISRPLETTTLVMRPYGLRSRHWRATRGRRYTRRTHASRSRREARLSVCGAGGPTLDQLDGERNLRRLHVLVLDEPDERIGGDASE